VVTATNFRSEPSTKAPIMGARSVSSENKMDKIFRGLAAFAFSAVVQVGLTGLAFAQMNAPSADSSAAPPPYGNSEAAQWQRPGEPPENVVTTDLPVLYVTSVEVIRTMAEPKLDIVRVTGLAASQGWGAPQLVPTYAGKPFDDILDLQFIATPPAQSENADGFLPVDAIFPLAPGHTFKGVRVRAAENNITIKHIPGISQTTVSTNDCKGCMGKKLLAEDHGQPGQQGVVRREDLPKTLRLIGASDGIKGAEQDPDRLTLILDEDNTIVGAFWE
jgi:hypothetical protein